jgi:serine protease Do
MLKECVLLLALAAAGRQAAAADTIDLRDKAAVAGTILAEKPDQVAVDIGFTVLSIPRAEIVKISRSGIPAAAAREAALAQGGREGQSKPAGEAPSGFYSVPGSSAPVKSVRELVNRLGEAVVQVQTPGGLGSGFFINEDGFLMTNFHVIEGETQISVEVYHQKKGELERRSYKQVRIIAINKFADLALLRIEDKDAPRFKNVAMGSADALAVGEQVFAIGSPLGLERTVTEGILSTKTRQMGGQLYLQTTTQINPGNSGGPLFNLGGEVVGVTNMKITFGEGLGFAIPAEAVKFFLDHREAFAYSNDNPNNPYHYLAPPSRAQNTNAMAQE